MTHPRPDLIAVDALHDLNECLTLVAEFVELAETALLDGNSAGARECLTLAMRSAHEAQAAAEATALRASGRTTHPKIKRTPNRGSCYQVNPPSLPRRRSARHMRILVVEDSPTLRDMFSIILRRVGHVVQTVALGTEALSWLEHAEFDIVISDLSLGSGLSGLDLVYAVRQAAPNVRFILATGSVDGPSAENCEQFGVDIVLTKPFTPSHLRQAVARLAADT